MSTVIRQAFARGEAVVGLVLTVALLSGKAHPRTLGLYLGVIGVFMLLQTALPVLPLRPRTHREQEGAADAESKPVPAALPHHPQQKQREEEGKDVQGQRPSPRRLVLRGLLASAVVLGTALLVYYVAPIAL
jgi:hypothetical protein